MTFWPGTNSRHAYFAVWGGEDSVSVTLGDGAIYDVTSGAWLSPSVTNINPGSPPAPSARFYHATVGYVDSINGDSMIVWGGQDTSGNFSDNAAHIYSINSGWSTPTVTSGTPPSARTEHAAVWTGTEMIVLWGINNTNCPDSGCVDGGSFNPSNDSWTTLTLPTTYNIPGRASPLAFWTGSAALFFSGSVLNDLVFYFPPAGSTANAQWGYMADPTGSNAPAASGTYAAVWTGSDLIAWEGTAGGVFVGAPPAYSNGWQIIGYYNNDYFCLLYNGSSVVFPACSDIVGVDAQSKWTWNFTSIGKNGSGPFEITLQDTNECLTFTPGNETVSLSTCNQGINQTWLLTTVLSGGSGFVISPVSNNSLCLDVASAGSATTCSSSAPTSTQILKLAPQVN
jgi:hypothetical protein